MWAKLESLILLFEHKFPRRFIGKNILKNAESTPGRMSEGLYVLLKCFI